MLAANRWLLSLALGCTFAPVLLAAPPTGARIRLGSTRFRIGDAGQCLALSADGTLLATGGGSTVRFWDRATGTERRAVGLPILSIFRVVFSPDGKFFAAIGTHMGAISRPFADVVDNSVFVGEVASGKVLHSFRGRYVTADFSDDSRWLLSHEGSSVEEREHPLVLWDIASGKEVRRFPAVRSYALSPDGKVLAGGSETGVIHLWDLRTGVERSQLKGHGSPVQLLAFSPDGKTLLSASGDRRGAGLRDDNESTPLDHGLRLWDIACGKELRRISYPHASFYRLRFAPDGKTFTAESEPDDLTLWDAQTGRLRQRFPRQATGIYDARFSPDSKFLFYPEKYNVWEQQQIVQWDIAAGKERRRWRTGESWIRDLRVAPNGKLLFGLGDALHVWDTSTGAEQDAGPGHRTAVRAMTFSRDGKWLASVDNRSRLWVWDAVRGVPLPSLCAENVLRCAFSLDGRLLLTISADASVQVREVSTGRSVRRFRVGDARTIRLWEWLTNARQDNVDLSNHPRKCCVLDSDDRILAVVDVDQCIHLWDVRRDKELRRLEGHRGEIHDLVFAPDGKSLFSRGGDGTIRCWDTGTGAEIQRFQADSLDPARFALSADGHLLAWAAGERIHLYDVTARRELRQWKGHSGETSRLQFGRGGAVLASTGDDNAIRYWDTHTGRELRAIARQKDQREIDMLAAPGGRPLAYFSLDGKNSEFTLRDVATDFEICQTQTYEREQFALAPDGHTVVLNRAKLVDSEKVREKKQASAEPPYPTPIRAADELEFRELASGAVIARVPSGHRGSIRCLAFAPDGETLATGGEDTTIALWDWRLLTRLRRADAAAPTEKDIASAWADLASPDARNAYRAIGILAASNDKAVTLLRERLSPAGVDERELQRRLLAGLDDEDFAGRERADRGLMKLGLEAYPLLRKATQAEKVSLEMRRRLERILASEEMKRPSGDSLRKIRAVQTLEIVATPAARKLLAEWSRGADDSWLTQEAQAAVRRLPAEAARQ